LRSAFQSSRVIGLIPQPLDRVGDGSLIRGKCSPDGGIVVDVLRHHLQDLRETRQRDKCWIEALLLGRVRERRPRQSGVLHQPVVNIQNFLGIGRSRSDLRQQRIGIKRDRSQQLVKLLRRRKCSLG
jgi:hypothetical protein